MSHCKPLRAGGVHIWLLDDIVSCELLSAANSLIIREKTGNFEISDWYRRYGNPKNARSSFHFRTIPWKSEQGILLADQGIALP